MISFVLILLEYDLFVFDTNLLQKDYFYEQEYFLSFPHLYMVYKLVRILYLLFLVFQDHEQLSKYDNKMLIVDNNQ